VEQLVGTIVVFGEVEILMILKIERDPLKINVWRTLLTDILISSLFCEKSTMTSYKFLLCWRIVLCVMSLWE